MTVMRVTMGEPGYMLTFTLDEATKTFTGYEDTTRCTYAGGGPKGVTDQKGTYTQDGDTYTLTEEEKIHVYVIEVNRAAGTAVIHVTGIIGRPLWYVGDARVES